MDAALASDIAGENSKRGDSGDADLRVVERRVEGIPQPSHREVSDDGSASTTAYDQRHRRRDSRGNAGGVIAEVSSVSVTQEREVGGVTGTNTVPYRERQSMIPILAEREKGKGGLSSGAGRDKDTAAVGSLSETGIQRALGHLAPADGGGATLRPVVSQGEGMPKALVKNDEVLGAGAPAGDVVAPVPVGVDLYCPLCGVSVRGNALADHFKMVSYRTLGIVVLGCYVHDRVWGLTEGER